MDFLTRLRQRKLVQWALAYLAAAWVLLQVAGLLSDTYEWPRNVMRLLPVALGIGLLIVLVLAWYHGEKGQQRAARAIDLLTRLLENRHMVTPASVRIDPRFAPLRGNPRFERLVNQ